MASRWRPFTPQQVDDIERLAQRDRLNMLFDGTPVAIVSLLGAAGVYVYLQAGAHAPGVLLLWYGVLLVTLVLRGAVAWAYRRRGADTAQAAPWLLRYRLVVLASCLTVGSISFLFDDPVMSTGHMLTLLVLVGLTAGALAVLPDFPSLAIYVLTLMAPAAVVSLRHGTEQSVGIGLLLLLLGGVFLRFSKVYNDNLTASLRLRYQNRALLTGLQRERNKLVNRLGRILNDSFNEIYVVDARSLRCVQVNAGAVRHLGYSENEICRLRLTDIVEDLDEAGLEQLLAPLREGRVEVVFHRGRHRRRDGSTYPVEIRLQLSSNEQPPVIVATALDISERLEYERQLTLKANFDQLTGLPNRHYMLSRIRDGLVQARRHERVLALLYMDLDNFKNVNDSMGHAAGDQLLQQAAERIRATLRHSDVPARLGGDEFLIMLEDLRYAEDAEVVAHKLVERFKQPFRIDGQLVYATTSVGISVFPEDGDEVGQLMQNADTAMYHAKSAGRSKYRFFSEDMRQASEKRLRIAGHLRHALANDELSVVYQPLVDLAVGRIVGAEALVRWHNPELGQVSPAQFIPLAECLGLIHEIGQFVLDHAARQAHRWRALGLGFRYVSVNVSSQQFRNGDLLACVDEALQTSGLDPRGLVLEITESLLIQDSHDPLTMIESLRARGVTLALDDFGTGYSALSYLKRFPLQILKIDRSFIKDLSRGGNDRVLVEAIISMAASLGLRVVAEGVEEAEQLAFLLAREVRLIQGYYFSPPVPADEFEALLEAGIDAERLAVAAEAPALPPPLRARACAVDGAARAAPLQ